MIFSITGTVWKAVLPFCILNALTSIVILVLLENDIVDCSISAQGHKLLSSLVAFLVVQRLTTSYNNFWCARTQLSMMLTAARLLASNVASFTRADQSRKACLFRAIVCQHISNAVQKAIEVLVDPDKTIQVCLQKEPYSHIPDDENPILLARLVSSAISLHKSYLKDPLIIHKEIELNQFTVKFINEFRQLTVYTSTPYPFPAAQLTRIFILTWLFTMPFALLSEDSLKPILPVLIFVITYGFFGLEFVSIELDDPFGQDPNDMEMHLLLKVSRAFKSIKLTVCTNY